MLGRQRARRSKKYLEAFMSTELENKILEQGLELLDAINNEHESIFDKNAWMGRMMDWVMKDPQFKVDLFRFVDVLPALESKDQLARHVKEYLLQEGRDVPLLMGTALKAASFSLTKGLAFSAIKRNVTGFASRFIVGRNLDDAQKKLLNISRQGFSFTIDLLGEATLSEKEANDYFDRYREIIEQLPRLKQKIKSSKNFDDPPNVSIKISALSSKLKEEAKDYSVNLLLEKVLPLLELAKEKSVFVNFDLESFQYHAITNDLFCRIIELEQFKNWPHLGIVVQAYLKNSAKDLDRLLDMAKKRPSPFSVRLVKGAYWDYELVKSKKLNIDCPVYLEKAETDLAFENLSKKLIDHCQYIRPAFASHNLRSLAHAIAYAQQKKHKKIGLRNSNALRHGGSRT